MNWPMVKLGEVVKLKTATTSNFVTSGKVQYVGLENLASGGGFDQNCRFQQTVPKSAKSIFESGNILFGKLRPNLRKVAIADFDGICSTDILTLSVTPKIELQYLYHVLLSEQFYSQVEINVRGINLPRINAKALLNLLIPLPPLEEQKRIAAILGSSKSVRAASETQVVKARELKSEYFRMLISDPSNISTHDDLLNVVDSIFDCPHSTPKWADFGIPCIWTNNVRERYFNWDAPRYVDEETFHLRSTRAYLQPGDIVLSREGTVGVAAVIPSGFRGCMGQRLVQVRPSTDGLPTPWILESLLYLLSPTRISRIMVGATSKHLNVRDLKKLQIPIPTDEALKQFIEFDVRTSDLALRLKAREDAVEELHQSLATRSFAERL